LANSKGWNVIKYLLRAVCAAFVMSVAFAGAAHAQDYSGRWYGVINWEGQDFDGSSITWDLGRSGSFSDSNGERGTWSTTTTGIVLRYIGGGESVYTGDLIGGVVIGWMTNGDIQGQFVFSRAPFSGETAGGGALAGGSGGTFPEGFNLEPAQAALAGDTSQLIAAFVWGTTDQGHDYWSALHGSGRPLPPEARAAVQDFVNRYQAGEREGGGGGGGRK